MRTRWTLSLFREVGRGRGEGRGAGDGLHAVEGPVDNCKWESTVEEKGAHIRSTTLESGNIGTNATEAKELRERDGVLTGCRV